jgi:hypothetical protein
MDTKALFYSHSGTSCRITVHEVMLLCDFIFVSSAHLCRSLSYSQCCLTDLDLLCCSSVLAVLLTYPRKIFHSLWCG